MGKILVTGAGGFIGYNLCNYLTHLGHSIIGVDLHYLDQAHKKMCNGFKLRVADFRNWDRMKEWLKGVEVVIHLASAHLQVSLKHTEYWDVNVHSLRPLLDLALKSGVQRFVHISSVGVYGNLEELPANEETNCKPQSIYGETKLAGEIVVREFSEKKGLPVVILRPAWVYGPFCPRTFKIYSALCKRRFIMIGNGENLRHPLYISDMIEALQLAIRSDSAVGELFIIAGQKAITTNELVDRFCSVMKLTKPRRRIPLWLGAILAWGIELLFSLPKAEPPISRRTLEFFDTNNAFDISKAKRLLGFNPQFSFEKGLIDSRDWLTGRE